MAEPINPWAPEHWNLTAQAAYAKQHGVARASARAADAGTTLGAPRPVTPFANPRIFVIHKAVQSGNPNRTEYLGFSGTGPFATLERFDLAMSPADIVYPGALAASKSKATAIGAPAADFSFVLTDNLIEYLANGTHIICTVTFTAGSNVGTFQYANPPVLVPFGTIPWLVMPPLADPVFVNAQILFVGDRQ